MDPKSGPFSAFEIDSLILVAIGKTEKQNLAAAKLIGIAINKIHNSNWLAKAKQPQTDLFELCRGCLIKHCEA